MKVKKIKSAKGSCFCKEQLRQFTEVKLSHCWPELMRLVRNLLFQNFLQTRWNRMSIDLSLWLFWLLCTFVLVVYQAHVWSDAFTSSTLEYSHVMFVSRFRALWLLLFNLCGVGRLVKTSRTFTVAKFTFFSIDSNMSQYHLWQLYFSCESRNVFLMIKVTANNIDFK